jgi:hypothetical protein
MADVDLRGAGLRPSVPKQITVAGIAAGQYGIGLEEEQAR